MLTTYFQSFRDNIIGIDHSFIGPYGEKKITYADWTASGRMYAPIERLLQQDIFPYVANTHTETTVTGKMMTHAYERSKKIIKKEVNATENCALVFVGSGMTGAIVKLQRILGLKIPERVISFAQKPSNGFGKRDCHTPFQIAEKDRPVVFITHMEHHSNHTSWLETIAELVVVPPAENGLVDPANFKEVLKKYKHRRVKIASITACSNVTGIQTPYHQIAKVMHEEGGLCFVDFACSGPYVDIDMNPSEEGTHLDAIFLSPHKFLGGPGTSGVLIFQSHLYNNTAPDTPGGGTVTYTNPWNGRRYITDIEVREDGGTPPFLQGIKAALAFQLKADMGTILIKRREEEILERLFEEFDQIPNMKVFANEHKDRLGVVSFAIEDLHYNLGVQLLNDHFGIQIRGGCACAGTYGHYLFQIGQEISHKIEQEIEQGVLSSKPGFMRLSIHPTTSDEEIATITHAIKSLATNHLDWAKDYDYNPCTNEFVHRGIQGLCSHKELVNSWFKQNAGVM